MTENIQRFLTGKRKTINQLNIKPILVHWLESPSMEQSLSIIDMHVEELLHKPGGMQKLEQWFLSGDEGFNAITAERYIIRYLRSKNDGIVDSLDPKGVDAHFQHNNILIGIEVTTLNKDIIDWVFIERLNQFLKSSSLLNDKSLEISYSQKKVWFEFQGKRIYEYLNNVGKAIVANASQEISNLGITVKHRSEFPSGISWRFHDSAEFIWFNLITDELNSRLREKGKVNQLKKYPRNLVFVGLNHSAPSDGIFPRIFNDRTDNGVYFHPELQEIKNYWNSQMPSLTNVIGICYFFYSLERETPFYPLKIFWRSEEDKININL